MGESRRAVRYSTCQICALLCKLVHTHHQDVLILRAIEDDDRAFLRHPLLDAGLILFKRTSLPCFTWNCSLYFIFDALSVGCVAGSGWSLVGIELGLSV
jgi:hypothetical protein